MFLDDSAEVAKILHQLIEGSEVIFIVPLYMVDQTFSTIDVMYAVSIW